MNISVVGTGYVGLVTATGLAELGHRVVAIDVDEQKIARLQRGDVPIHEEGLDPLVQKNLEQGRLVFSASYDLALEQAEVVFIAVGTPSDLEGRADLQYVLSAAETIGRKMTHPLVVVNKSTVPPGTAKKVKSVIAHRTSLSFEVVSCPEFLREGTGVEDFFHPDRIVIGAPTEASAQALLAVFDPIKTEKIVTSVESAEMIKYASNAFLATKISFINEIAHLCEASGADVEEVAYGMGRDQRIGPKFLKAGLGYGGSCFPKDVRALNHIANGHQYNFKLLKAVIEVNNQQREFVIEKLRNRLGTLQGKRIGVLGLTFKSNTDDVRESASLEIIEKLEAEGATVVAFDPIGAANARKVMPSLTIEETIDKTLDSADAAIIATEWPLFKQADWARLARKMRRPLVIDGRNLLDLRQMERLKIEVVSIGRTGKSAAVYFSHA